MPIYRVSKIEMSLNPCCRGHKDFDNLEEAKSYMQTEDLQSKQILICIEYDGEDVVEDNFKQVVFIKASKNTNYL